MSSSKSSTPKQQPSSQQQNQSEERIKVLEAKNNLLESEMLSLITATEEVTVEYVNTRQEKCELEAELLQLKKTKGDDGKEDAALKKLKDELQHMSNQLKQELKKSADFQKENVKLKFELDRVKAAILSSPSPSTTPNNVSNQQKATKKADEDTILATKSTNDSTPETNPPPPPPPPTSDAPPPPPPPPSLSASTSSLPKKRDKEKEKEAEEPKSRMPAKSVSSAKLMESIKDLNKDKLRHVVGLVLFLS